jgi:hypothetical protein
VIAEDLVEPSLMQAAYVEGAVGIEKTVAWAEGEASEAKIAV